ncbi:MAG: pyridoxamine 5'-phosphate oxidase family protein [Candidatus Kariarchaeaceae archaeon]
MVKISQKELDYLLGQQLGRIATVSSDHSPHVTPVAFASDEERLYLNIEHSSKKAKNIRSNSKVQFVVDDFLSFEEFRGVLIRGEAELISSGDFHEIGRNLIYSKYPNYQEQYPIQEDGWSKYILVITPTKVSSWGPLNK